MWLLIFSVTSGRRVEQNRPVGGEIDIGDWPQVEIEPLNEFDVEGIVCKASLAYFPMAVVISEPLGYAK